MTTDEQAVVFGAGASLPTAPAPNTITVEVHGTPAPKGSHRVFNDRAGRARSTPDNRRSLKLWETAVVDAANHARFLAGIGRRGKPALDGPLVVSIVFRFAMPASRPALRRRHGVWPRDTKPDLDKLARACLDALTRAGLIADDRHITDLVLAKREVTGVAGATITVRPWATADFEALVSS